MELPSDTVGADSQTNRVFCEYFRDNSGQRALRYGRWTGSPSLDLPWPPTDYVATPHFCFQVYLSVDLDLIAHGADEVESAGGSPAALDSVSSTLSNKCHHLAHHLWKPIDLQLPEPLWEFYVLPGAHVLDMVEHSRREILHRKKLRNDGRVNVPLIPKLQAFKGGRSAFLFAIDNDQGWEKVNDRTGEWGVLLKWPNRSGPVWARFDPRLPTSVTTVDQSWRLPSMRNYSEQTTSYPERLDVMVTRIQHRQDSSLEMQMLYPDSWLHMTDDGTVDGRAPDSGNTSHEELSFFDVMRMLSSLSINDAQTKLDSRDVHIEDQGDFVRLSNNHGPDVSPDLRYVIYVPFVQLNDQDLDTVARAFTARLLDYLPSDKKIELHFHVPRGQTDASVLSHFRSLALETGSIGTLTYLMDEREFQRRWDLGSIDEPQQRRLHPLAIEPDISWNDPSTLDCEPYKTFVIVIDRPDFDTAAAVRFLVADGGKPRGYERFLADDYCEMKIWRAPSVRDVARRLSFARL